MGVGSHFSHSFLRKAVGTYLGFLCFVRVRRRNHHADTMASTNIMLTITACIGFVSLLVLLLRCDGNTYDNHCSI